MPDDLLGRLHDLASRLVFGSDYPSIPHTYATQVRGVATLALGDDDLRRVFAGTARRLLARRRPPDG